MNEWWLRMKTKWSELGGREKRAVVAGGAILSLFILYQFIITPYYHYIDSLREKITSNQRTLVWMEQADKEIKQLQKNNTQQTDISPAKILSTIKKQTQSFNLENYLTQLKQTSNDAIEMQFQNVVFDKLMTLMISLSKNEKITINQFNVAASNTPGIVNATLILKL